MATLADFLPDVQPHCDGVPIAVAERMILHAVREFCSKSGYWRDDQLFTTVTDESATGAYTLTLAAGTELVSVVTPILHGNKPVTLQNEEWLTEYYAEDWRTQTGETATFFTMSAKTIVRLVPYPTVAVADDLRVTRILRPSLASPTVDDTVHADWCEQIGWGALARLKAMPERQWTDLTTADAYLEMFKDACNDGQSRAIAKWQDRRFQRKRTVAGHQF